MLAQVREIVLKCSNIPFPSIYRIYFVVRMDEEGRMPDDRSGPYVSLCLCPVCVCEDGASSISEPPLPHPFVAVSAVHGDQTGFEPKIYVGICWDKVCSSLNGFTG